MADPLAALVDDIERARAAFLSVTDWFEAKTAESPIGEGRWSPTEYLEHLVRAEEVTIWRMFKAVVDSRRGGSVLPSPDPAATIEEIVERTWAPREQAPPLAVPQLGAPASYWVERMRRNTGLVAGFANFVTASELDRVAYGHPISGPFTMRQGLQFIRFHLDRHCNQLANAGRVG